MCNSERQKRFVRQAELRDAVIGETYKRPSRATTPVPYFYSPTDSDNHVARKAIPKKTATKTPSATGVTVVNIVPPRQYPRETSPISGNDRERCKKKL